MHKDDLATLKELANSIKTIRKLKEVSQLDLAILLDISSSTVGTIENGHRDPKLSQLMDFARKLDHKVVVTIEPL